MANAPIGVTLTVAVACKMGLTALVAVIVTEVWLVTLLGLKTPLLEILPALADQVTAVFAVPLTLAVKSCCPFEGMVVLLGESEMVMPGLGELVSALETTIPKELEPERVEPNSCPLTGTGRGLSDSELSDTTSTDL
jgi:hypothetical protein